MELQLLQANEGDAIHLRFIDEEGMYRNILIDGGTKDTYTYKDSKGKIKDGALKQLVSRIREQGEQIDLLIMTHVDDDHIGGILQWFGDKNNQTADLVKKVWFNSGRIIFKFFNQPPVEDNDLAIPESDSFETSIKQGVAFEDFILKNGLWDEELIISGKVFELFGLKFTILSPSEDKLQKLLDKWQTEAPITETSRTSDWETPLSELIVTDSFKSDQSIPNGSAIAFIVENKETKLLFTGDAYATPVVDSLKALGYTTKKPLEAAFFKLSHHGSKGNTNVTLLNLIKSDNYLISTNSAVHGLPDKRLLARLINNKKKLNLYFNYPDLIEEIFTEQDLKDFPKVSLLSAKEAIVI